MKYSRICWVLGVAMLWAIGCSDSEEEGNTKPGGPAGAGGSVGGSGGSTGGTGGTAGHTGGASGSTGGSSTEGGSGGNTSGAGGSVSCEQCCDDGLACTSDACVNDVCEHTIEQGWCVIQHACVQQGATNPSNPCVACDPAKTTSQYTALPDGTPCGGSQTCLKGQCGGAPPAGRVIAMKTHASYDSLSAISAAKIKLSLSPTNTRPMVATDHGNDALEAFPLLVTPMLGTMPAKLPMLSNLDDNGIPGLAESPARDSVDSHGIPLGIGHTRFAHKSPTAIQCGDGLGAASMVTMRSDMVDNMEKLVKEFPPSISFHDRSCEGQGEDMTSNHVALHKNSSHHCRPTTMALRLRRHRSARSGWYLLLEPGNGRQPRLRRRELGGSMVFGQRGK